MATSPNLPIGAFLTMLGGRRCTALPRTDISSIHTSTASTFPTSSIVATSSAARGAPQVAPVPAVQSTSEPACTTPAPAAATAAAESTSTASTIASPLPSSSPSSPLPPVPPFSAAAVPQSQASETDSSTTALSTALTTPRAATTPALPPAAAATTVLSKTTAGTTAATPSVPHVAPSPPQSDVLHSTPAATAAATPFTTTRPGSTTVTAGSGAETTGSTVVVAAGNGSGRSDSTVAVVGGIVGGVALVSLIAFVIWFWRRRATKRQRDTLLTPLTADPSFGREIRNEKAPYLIERDSIGPTPRSTKVKAALKAQYGRVRDRFDNLARSTSVRSPGSHSSQPSVDMNRGNSQFLDSSPVMRGHERNGSSAFSAARDDAEPTIKERIMEMWTRFVGSGKPNLAGEDRNDIFAARGITGSMKDRAGPSARRASNEPDFLTLLNMDNGELDRKTQKRRIYRRAGSEGSGLGGLDLDFANDPFSDVHALPQNGPPVAYRANNPFSDAHAIIQPPKPSTYVDGIRRSRHQSLGSSAIDPGKAYNVRGLRVVNEDSRPPSKALGGDTSQYSAVFRDSQASASSIDSFATKRDKFRSDPFDLEQLSSQVSGSIPSYTARPGFTNSSSKFSTDAMRFSSSKPIAMHYQMSAGSKTVPGALAFTRPAAAHARPGSESSSQYTSGLSAETLDDWSEPGPDVGPGAEMRWDASRRSSAADAFNLDPDGSSWTGNSSNGGGWRSRQNGGVKMGYAR